MESAKLNIVHPLNQRIDKEETTHATYSEHVSLNMQYRHLIDDSKYEQKLYPAPTACTIEPEVRSRVSET